MEIYDTCVELEIKETSEDYWYIFWWQAIIDTLTLRRKFPVWESLFSLNV